MPSHASPVSALCVTSIPSPLLLDGQSLTVHQLYALGYDDQSTIGLTAEAWDRVEKSRALVDQLAAGQRPVYGINTGFGNFATVSIPADKLSELQENLIASHAAGTGQPLSPERTRMLLALRINVLAKGFSGIRRQTLETMIRCFNSHCLSFVPQQGTVGASGDLAPLSHLAFGLMGNGDMWDRETNKFSPAAEVLAKHGIEPVRLGPKEGLAMINGTQFISSLGAEAAVRADNLVRIADIVGALTLEVLKGTHRAFDHKIHDARPHSGQVNSARRLRDLLLPGGEASQLSKSHETCNRVQDSYTLRCMPQVHGVTHDTMEFVKTILNTELNSATDNPMIFAETGESISGGNFHGEYPAKALDYLAIGVHELSNISERRIERLVNPALSGLPAFLVQNGGLHSGFMIAHCTAAALVSENKVLTHPASVDSISTSASKEDHVSMGGYSARKALEVVTNVEKVLAIELLSACQALEFLRPMRTTPVLESVFEKVRAVAKCWQGDRYMAPDIENVWQLIRSGSIREIARQHGIFDN